MGSEEQPNLPGPGDQHPNWRRRWSEPAASMLDGPGASRRLQRLDDARRQLEAKAMNEVRATLRLQFHRGFTLDDAVPLVHYFARLGISHVYASPLLTARKGSVHGYDVVDPTRVNPELGARRRSSAWSPPCASSAWG